jgi:Tfp pilus assembly protein PilF
MVIRFLFPVRSGPVLAGWCMLILLALNVMADDSEKIGTSPDDLVTQAGQDLADGKIDVAMQEVSLAIQLDPKNVLAYEQRSAIYVQQKLWDRAESDIAAADKISPDPAYKYRMGEIKFLQKDYDDARPKFAALVDDSHLGDLATYKTFLCDLFGGHERIAARDLAALPAMDPKPSYFFCHAAWELFHNHRAGANQWFGQAQKSVDKSTAEHYISSLLEVQRFKAPKATFLTTDGRKFDQARVFLESGGLRVSTDKGWVTLPLDQLPEDLSPFPEDIREQIARRRAMATAQATTAPLITFTTLSGKTYDHVRWSLEGAGLSVLTTDGWISVPFEQLPADLAGVPPDVQKVITDRRKATADAEIRSVKLLTFTTRDGKIYSDVRTSLEPAGLRVVTAQGLAEVPFEQLADDLTPFPEAWRATIVARQREMLKSSTGARFAPTSDLSPPQARDSNFGSCVALEGALMVVGGKGAAYVYANGQLVARLCPRPDATGTGDAITSVAVSGQTVVTGTPQGIFVWLQSRHDWSLQAALDLPGPATTVSIDGDDLLAIVDGKGDAPNSVYYFSRQGGIWQPISRTSHYDRDTLSADRFGCIGALRARVALIGVPDWSHASYLKGGEAQSGRAYLERFDGKMWSETGMLVPDDAPTGANQFGGSVALDESLAAISSTNHDTIHYAPHHGSVHLFRQTVDGWKQVAVLKAPNNDAGFGSAPLALSHGTLAVGDAETPAQVDDVILDTGERSKKAGSIQNAGAVYIFDGEVLQATLTASDPVDSLNHLGSLDGFATSLALDGDTLAIGAPGKNGGTGAVYLWKRRKGGWQSDTELTGFHRQADFHY